jgi:hypothetical protein
MEVLVFKTNIRYRKNIDDIGTHLDSLQGIIRWNVDLHDRDKVLRIEAQGLCAREIENTLAGAGYSCEELV